MNEKRFIKVFWFVKASLIVVLAYAGFRAITGHLSIKAFDPGTASGDEALPDEESADAQTKWPSDPDRAFRGSLFSGSDDAGDRPATPGRSNALDSLPSAEELGLSLVGTIAGGPAISRANIHNAKANTTGVYKIGDTVAAATVEAIQHNAVVLRHEGRQLVLRLRISLAANDAQPSNKEQAQAEEKAPAGERTALPSMKADYIAEVFRKATVEPYVKNNRTEGLRISGLDKIPMAEMFGLKNGDVIQTVNGQQLTSKQKAFQVLMKARTQSKVDIQLLRNGKNKDLSFDL